MVPSIVTLFAFLSLGSALPWQGPPGYQPHGPGGYHPHGNPRHGGGSPSGRNGPQVPFKFPLANGFPNITIPSSALKTIEEEAHGTLPNSPLPSSLTSLSATTFQVIATAELFEVAYFSALLQNVTERRAGYDIEDPEAHAAILEALTAIRAQEEIHALGLNAILETAHHIPVQPCEYVFPVDNFDDAIVTAAAFTDTIVLGGLQDALNTFATDGDTDVIGLLTSVVGQEGEQAGFYRILQNKIPSALPFLTRSTGVLAYSYINQHYIVPGTCKTSIDVPILKPLHLEGVTTTLKPENQTLRFSFEASSSETPAGLSLVYLNQQNLPIMEKLENVHRSENRVSFTADFPYDANEMNGLTLAVVTKGSGPFADADDVASAAVFGPAVIEID